MPVEKFSFNEKEYLNNGEVFSSKVEKEDWVFFHGTSSIMENVIDTKGLYWSNTGIGKAEVQMVLDIFNEMGWTGISGGGYCVLQPFTMKHDFGDKNEKPIYLAEHSHRAILFTLREYAGGETQRSIRHCFNNLEKYRADSAVRSRHEEDQINNIKLFDLYYKDRPEEGMTEEELEVKKKMKLKLNKVDLHWLDNKLRSIQYIKDTCFQSLDEYKYGLVYAIKLNKENLEGVSYHNAMGIKCLMRLPSDSIIGKVVIPRDFEYQFVHPSCNYKLIDKKHRAGELLIDIRDK